VYNLELKEECDKIFSKLAKKNKPLLLIVIKKINEIRSFSDHNYKFLRKPLQNYNRVHIGHFVLIFKMDHKRKIVTIYYFNHHDMVYEWKE